MHLDTGIARRNAADDLARLEAIDADAKQAERDRHNARLRDERALSAAIDRLTKEIGECYRHIEEHEAGIRSEYQLIEEKARDREALGKEFQGTYRGTK